MLEYLPDLKMYRSTTPTPPVFQLRAWVELAPDLLRLLCEIWTVNGQDVTCRTIATDQFFMIDRAQVHSVHKASATTGEVIHFYGKPKPC